MNGKGYYSLIIKYIQSLQPALTILVRNNEAVLVAVSVTKQRSNQPEHARPTLDRARAPERARKTGIGLARKCSALVFAFVLHSSLWCLGNSIWSADALLLFALLSFRVFTCGASSTPWSAYEVPCSSIHVRFFLACLLAGA